jgi:P4 family phage/plasmid primase-like protien
MATNNTFEAFLIAHKIKKGDASIVTNTRIGIKDEAKAKALKIYGGSYHIPDDEWSDFMRRYYKHVFVDKKVEYLTEKQLIGNGPILVDVDFRYAATVKTRQHTEAHIQDLAHCYLEELSEMLNILPGSVIDVFVLEKDAVNTTDKTATKDGIHLLIGISLHKGLQVILRDRILNKIHSLWSDLPITNTWEDVLDEGVTKGQCGWQMYGSRKPEYEAYKLTGYYLATYVDEHTGWRMNTVNKNVQTFLGNLQEDIVKLSARYTGYPEFEAHEELEPEFDAALASLGSKGKPGANKRQHGAGASAAAATGGAGGGAANPRPRALLEGITENTSEQILHGLTEDLLEQRIDETFSHIAPCDYHYKETHAYVNTLPVAYYGPGSHNKRLRVCWALKNMSISGLNKGKSFINMFLVYLQMCSQREDFDWTDTHVGKGGKGPWKYLQEWNDQKYRAISDESISFRSIMYWSKLDAPEKYKAIKTSSTEYFVSETLKHDVVTEYDMACVLHSMYKGNFVCVSIKNDFWYQYFEHRWEPADTANDLRSAISKELWQVYHVKSESLMAELSATPNESTEELSKLRDSLKKLQAVMMFLKKTVSKNNVMREARELFYDKDFLQKIDQNVYLMGFENCVVDFKNKMHRPGQPDDYLSMTTKIPYIEYDEDRDAFTLAEINLFLNQLFPNPSLRAYMLEHLAGALIGANKNQTFSIYKGSGRNGKSKLMDLMTICMGQYKGTVPITLITQKRTSIGSTSSEVAQLKGVRLAIMQEPSKGDKINEGIMKEITGGDPIQARALFKDTITFVPQFTLAVCTNTDFEDLNNDDGTWRRIKEINFEAKFLDRPYEDAKFPAKDYKYQFPVDYDINEKFSRWAPVFMSLLVKVAYTTQGVVKDCAEVVRASEKLRKRQDYMTRFYDACIRPKENGLLMKQDVTAQLKLWMDLEIGSGGAKGKMTNQEIFAFMDSKCGDYKPITCQKPGEKKKIVTCWFGYEVIDPNQEVLVDGAEEGEMDAEEYE